MKYIIVNRQGLPSAILFAEHVNHSDAINQKDIAPISAGFCTLKNGAVTVTGESNSLNLQSRPEDAAIIRLTLLLTGLIPTINDDDFLRICETYLPHQVPA